MYKLHNFPPGMLTPAVQMTAAASGSSGIVAADSDEYDFGETDFGIFSTIQYQLLYCEVQHKKQSAIERWVFYINGTDNLAGAPLGTPTLVCLVGGSAVIAVEAPAQIPASIAVVSIGVSVVRETAGSAGSAQFFYNGAPLGAPVSIAAAATQSLSNTGPLYLSGDDSKRFASGVISAILLNFAPTAQQVSTLYSSGIPAEWMWGSNVSTNSANFINQTAPNNYVTFSGASATGFTAASDGSNVDSMIATTPSVLEFENGVAYRLSFSATLAGVAPIYAPCADGLGTLLPGASFQNLVAGENEYIFTPTATDASATILFANGASVVTDYTVSDLQIIRLGATLALLPETLPISPPLEWPDSANGNDGTLPAAGATKVTIRK